MIKGLDILRTMSSVSDIYDVILSEIEQLKQNFMQGEADEELKEINKQLVEKLSPLHERIINNIDELKANAEWDTFSIAFYGETGSGKSTIIETLRILLEENTKMDQRKLFKQVENTIAELEDEYQQLKDKQQVIVQDYQKN